MWFCGALSDFRPKEEGLKAGNAGDDDERDVILYPGVSSLYGPGDRRGELNNVLSNRCEGELRISGVSFGHLGSLLTDRPRFGESRSGKSSTC